MNRKHPQDDGQPYVCERTPDLFAPRLKPKKLVRAEASRKGWRNRNILQETQPPKEKGGSEEPPQ